MNPLEIIIKAQLERYERERVFKGRRFKMLRTIEYIREVSKIFPEMSHYYDKAIHQYQIDYYGEDKK